MYDPLTTRQRQIAKYMRDFDEDLIKRKKTLKWKIKHAINAVKRKIGLL
mgnify:CR=1 FL=1